MEVDSASQIQQVIDAVVTPPVPDDTNVIMIEDSTNGFVDVTSATHKGKKKLLCQAKREEKEKAQVDAKAKAEAQTSPAKNTTPTTVKTDTDTSKSVDEGKADSSGSL